MEGEAKKDSGADTFGDEQRVILWSGVTFYDYVS